MKYKIEVERTFAGKQFENLKPKISVEYDSEDTAPNTSEVVGKLASELEVAGAKWKEEQLGKS